MSRDVWAQIPSSAPCPKSFENSGFSGFSFAFRNHFFVGRRIIEIVDFYIIHVLQGSASAIVFYLASTKISLSILGKTPRFVILNSLQSSGKLFEGYLPQRKLIWHTRRNSPLIIFSFNLKKKRQTEQLL